MRASIGSLAATAAIVLSAFAPGAFAADDSTGPALGVARISLVQGDVAIMRGDSGDWIAATPNMPVVEGDSVQTRGDARAEVQLAYGNFVRIGSAAEILFLGLERKQFRLRVLQGTVIYSELPKSEADIDIETPLAAVRPMKPGRYRVSVDSAATYISVSKGKTEVAFQDHTTAVESGRMMIVREGTGGTEYEISRNAPRLVLDEWAAARDKEISRSKSYRYVSRDIYGAGELDYYGEWRYVVGVGYSWFPYVTASWVPYRHGRWIWLDYYGWSWVGAEPWGWSPYHWGRWYRHSIYGWGWYPGAPSLRHIWRPALVTFFGYGPRYRFSRIGWCPLGPGERYEPWYGRRYYEGGARNVIVADGSVRIYNHYRNARAAAAVSYLEASNFGRGAAQTPRSLRLAGASSPVAIRGPLPVVPDRTSQGRVLQAGSSGGSRAALTELRRSGSSVLRDGTARLSFDAQRNRVRASVEEFERTHRSAAAVQSNTSVRPQTQPALPVPDQARTPAPASSARGAATPSSTGTAPVVGSARRATTPTRVPGGATRTTTVTSPDVRSGNSVRTGVAVTSTTARRSSPTDGSTRVPNARPTVPPIVFSPRTNSRIRTGRPPQPPVARSPSRTVPRSAQQRQSSRATIGSTTTVRPQGQGRVTRSTVYAPRTTSRVDGSTSTATRSSRPPSSIYTPRTSSRSSTPSPVYVPRTSPRSSGSSRTSRTLGGNGSSRRSSGPSYFPRSSSRSAPSYGGSRSSSPGYSSRGSRSSSPTYRSPSPSSSRSGPSFGGSRSSSGKSIGNSRSSSSTSRSSSSSVSRSSSSRSSSSSSRDR